MIFAFSTSSRQASVAIFAPTGALLWSGELDAPQSASSACIRLLTQARDEGGFKVEEGSLFVADLGPGSFTGVRVGIVLAKSFGFLYSKPCAGADAFDLVATDQVVVLPLKRGELFVRRPGEEPYAGVPWDGDVVTGYGPLDLEPNYPHAARFGPLLSGLALMSPEELVPKYLLEPSISIPKTPIAGVGS